MKTNDTKYWLTLLRTPGIGPVKGKKLLEASNIEDIIKPNQNLIAQDLKWLAEPQHHLITIQDPQYPTLLKEIADPPLALFVDGDPTLLSTPQLGIVGSRNPSHAGLDNAYDFAKFLTQTGLTITSGLAMGIDTESHKGALATQGKTIAVLGTGINKIYPATNKALAKQIVAAGGAIISEFATNMPAKAENFPRRNRIISGLSAGVLIIEATIRSGSLITARLAAEQGREVFAIPGSIHNPLARGCHQLIRQGAKLIETAQDVLEEFVGAQNLVPLPFVPQHSVPQQNNIDSDHQNLLKYVDYETTPIDVLVERSGLPANQVASMLLILELQEHVKSTPGGYIKHGKEPRNC